MKSKRILIITDIKVLPLDSGEKARAWALMNNLRLLGHEVTFLGLGLSKENVEALVAQWGPRVHNLTRKRARAEAPWFYLLKRFVTNRLIALGIGSPGVDHWIWPYWERGIAEFSAAHQFDVVIAEHVFFSKALLHFGPEVLKIVDAHDVWTGRLEKYRAYNTLSFHRYLTSVDEEARGLARADVVMSIQENEAIFFRKILGDSKPVITVGHMIDPQPLPLPLNSDVLFLGSTSTPNIEGLLHFLKACLPVIRAVVPDARLLVAGSICEAAVLQRELPGVKLLGKMENLESAYRSAAVAINPVRFGTGLKTKTIEALSFGRALVTTPSGADGIEVAEGTAFLLAQNDAQFSAAVVELLTNRAKLESLAAGGLGFIKSWNAMQLDALQSILSYSK